MATPNPIEFGGNAFQRHWTALKRGLARKCPACGRARMFSGYIEVVDACPSCRTDLSIYPSDDAPAYFTVAIVGHLMLPSVLLTERLAAPPAWMQMAFWLPLTLILTLALLPRVKGMIIAIHWAVGLKG